MNEYDACKSKEHIEAFRPGDTGRCMSSLVWVLGADPAETVCALTAEPRLQPISVPFGRRRVCQAEFSRGAALTGQTSVTQNVR